MLYFPLFSLFYKYSGMQKYAFIVKNKYNKIFSISALLVKVTGRNKLYNWCESTLSSLKYSLWVKDHYC